MINFEKLPNIEKIGENKEKLLQLEKEGKYYFHGSPDVIGILVPQQAYNHNEETGKMEKDGEPAVFATPYADVAIFRALVNTKGVSGESTSSFGINGEQLYFSATKNLLESAKDKIGRVYVLDKLKLRL